MGISLGADGAIWQSVPPNLIQIGQQGELGGAPGVPTLGQPIPVDQGDTLPAGPYVLSWVLSDAAYSQLFNSTGTNGSPVTGNAFPFSFVYSDAATASRAATEGAMAVERELRKRPVAEIEANGLRQQKPRKKRR